MKLLQVKVTGEFFSIQKTKAACDQVDGQQITISRLFVL